MYNTFDVADAPGDTQPDSQMFRQYTSGIVDSHSNIVPDPYTLLAADSAVESPGLQTDEIEIQGSSQSQRSPTVTSPTVMNDDSEIQDQTNDPVTSPLKFETPAVAGRKRDSHGQVISPAYNTTPATGNSASAVFGFGDTANGHGMSLTQVFNATQARTSPMVGLPTEDPIFQRPSPNFVRPSSPPVAISSPIKNNAKQLSSSPALRSSSEPRTDYETMRQSQERRSHGPPHYTTSIIHQDSWELPTAAELRFNRQREKNMQDEQAAQSLAVISAPSPTNRRGKKRRPLLLSGRAKSPRRRNIPRRAIYDGPHDDTEDEDSSHELSQSGPVNGDRGESPDDSSQVIPPNSSAHRPRTSASKDSDTNNRVQVPNTSSHPPYVLSGQSTRNFSQPDTPVSQLAPASQFKTPSSTIHHNSIAKLKSSKESEIVMDSQPDPDAAAPVSPHPKERQLPSTPSTNQYSINQTTMNGHTGFTSQVVSSSIPPMPPSQHTQEEIDEDVPLDNARVPSSPPLVLAEDEDNVTYDEHAYEEHPNGGCGTGSARATQEDVDMEDEDGLPVVVAHEGKVESTKDEGDPAVPTIPDTDPPVGDEVPETLDQEDPMEVHNEEEELIRSSHPEADIEMGIEPPAAPPRLHRQSTIPETDMLEDTQPSFFPEQDTEPQHGEHAEGSTVDTTSTTVFHTGKEQQSASEPVATTGDSLKENAADVQSSQIPLTRSLLEIANQPATQRSMDLADLDIPQLSFIETDESTEMPMSRSSPVRLSKRRKITYSTKKFPHSPAKGVTFGPGFSSSGKEQLSEMTSVASSTPTQDQEHLGALAAVRARDQAVHAQPHAPLKSEESLESEGSLESHPQTPRKQDTSKDVSKTLPAKASGVLSSPDSSVLQQSVRSDRPMRSTELLKAGKGAKAESKKPKESVPDIPINTTVVESASNDGEAPTGDLLCPNRVIAYWPGGRNFYPATCLGTVKVRSLEVRFDDGNTTFLENTQVCAFDLRIGDQVKVDQTGMKKHAYVVVGFKDRVSVDDLDKFQMTDRHGYATVVLEEKTRDTLPAVKTNSRYYDVPMGDIYLTTTLWSRLRERVYEHTTTNPTTVSDLRPSTPTTTHGSPLITPTMSRRSVVGQSLLRESTTRAASVASSIRSDGTVFSNMAFAITLTKTPSDKDSIVKLITSNGGLVFEAFDELFDSPVKTDDSKGIVIRSNYLSLKREHRELSFAALISDAHSRRLKHFQALALNIPAIHTRWIADSLSASHPLPFAKYSLPAGASTYLDPAGVILSRNMTLYNPASEDLSFTQILEDRSLLLAKQSVLFITGRTKVDVEKMRSYMFLTHALGPEQVARYKDVASAKEMVDTGDWDWVYVHGGAKGVEDAAAILFADDGDAKAVPAGKKRGSTAAAVAGKKRKKEGETVEPQVLVRSGDVKGRKVRIACDEFITQSLILGSLVEE